MAATNGPTRAPDWSVAIWMASDGTDQASNMINHDRQSLRVFGLESLGRQVHPVAPPGRANHPQSGGVYYGPGDPRDITQPLERDAESFGRRVIDILPARW